MKENINKKLLDLLACPFCKNQIILKQEVIICQKCNHEFAMVDNIPILTKEVNLENLIYNIPWHTVPEKADSTFFLKNKIKKMVEKNGVLLLLQSLIFWDPTRLYIKKKIDILINRSHFILDVGCREASYTRNISNNKIAVGIDVDLPSCRFARSLKLKNFEVILASGGCLPFISDSFDLIICSEVIEHIKDDKNALFEMSRVLKKNGVAVITTPDGETYKEVTKLHYRHYTENEFFKALRPNFREITIKKLLNSFWLWRIADRIESILKNSIKNKLFRSVGYLLFYLVNFITNLIHLILKKYFVSNKKGRYKLVGICKK